MEKNQTLYSSYKNNAFEKCTNNGNHVGQLHAVNSMNTTIHENVVFNRPQVVHTVLPLQFDLQRAVRMPCTNVRVECKADGEIQPFG